MKNFAMLMSGCGLGLSLLASAELTSAPAGKHVDVVMLQTIRGGWSFYCATVDPDEAATNCKECSSNGNGGSILCTVGPNAQKPSDYIVGQTPRFRVDCANDTKCNPLQQAQTAKMYTYCGDCSSCGFYMTTCLRQVQTCGTGMDPGTCPPP